MISSDMVRPRLEVAGYNYQAALRRLVGLRRDWKSLLAGCAGCSTYVDDANHPRRRAISGGDLSDRPCSRKASSAAAK